MDDSLELLDIPPLAANIPIFEIKEKKPTVDADSRNFAASFFERCRCRGKQITTLVSPSHAARGVDNIRDLLFNAALLQPISLVSALRHTYIRVQLINTHRAGHFSTMCNAFNHTNDIFHAEEFYFASFARTFKVNIAVSLFTAESLSVL